MTDLVNAATASDTAASNARSAASTSATNADADLTEIGYYIWSPGYYPTNKYHSADLLLTIETNLNGYQATATTKVSIANAARDAASAAAGLAATALSATNTASSSRDVVTAVLQAAAAANASAEAVSEAAAASGAESAAEAAKESAKADVSTYLGQLYFEVAYTAGNVSAMLSELGAANASINATYVRFLAISRLPDSVSQMQYYYNMTYFDSVLFYYANLTRQLAEDAAFSNTLASWYSANSSQAASSRLVPTGIQYWNASQELWAPVRANRVLAAQLPLAVLAYVVAVEAKSEGEEAKAAAASASADLATLAFAAEQYANWTLAAVALNADAAEIASLNGTAVLLAAAYASASVQATLAQTSSLDALRLSNDAYGLAQTMIFTFGTSRPDFATLGFDVNAKAAEVVGPAAQAASSAALVAAQLANIPATTTTGATTTPTGAVTQNVTVITASLTIAGQASLSLGSVERSIIGANNFDTTPLDDQMRTYYQELNGTNISITWTR